MTKQTVIHRSIIEVELVALDLAYSKVEWTKNLSSSLSRAQSINQPISLNYDNKVAVDFYKNKLINTKQVDILK